MFYVNIYFLLQTFPIITFLNLYFYIYIKVEERLNFIDIFIEELQKELSLLKEKVCFYTYFYILFLFFIMIKVDI
jgi:hypothetical protein